RELVRPVPERNALHADDLRRRERRRLRERSRLRVRSRERERSRRRQRDARPAREWLGPGEGVPRAPARHPCLSKFLSWPMAIEREPEHLPQSDEGAAP